MRLFVAFISEMSAKKEPTVEFWTKASAALQAAPRLRSTSQELRSRSQRLCARNHMTNLLAQNLSARVYDLVLGIEQSDDYGTSSIGGPLPSATRKIAAHDSLTDTLRAIA